MISQYDAVFFDAGGTLFYPFPSVGEIYERIAKKHGAQANASHLQERFISVWKKRDGLVSLESYSNEKVEKLWWKSLVEDVFATTTGIQDFEVFFDELYDVFARPDAWQIFPDVLDVLERIKQSGKKMGIVSNWDSRLLRLCESLGVAPYFDFIIASAVFGASKPSSKIFMEALKKAGVEPSRAVHIGDSIEDDMVGAHRVGLDGILIRRQKHEDHHIPEEIRPPVIHSLRELLE